MKTDLKILILEDNPKIAEELKTMITEFGYEVSGTVKSYEEALESVKNNPPDLALCDIKIHGFKDGIQTARAIKKIIDIPVIYLTAFIEDEIQDRALETEPAAYLIKPINYNQLEVALKVALRNLKNQSSISSLNQDNLFYVWIKGVYEVINPEEIIYLEADNVNTQIVSAKKNYVVLSKTLKKMMEELNCPFIVRVSRSEAVNVRKITQFSKGPTYILLDSPETKNKDRIKGVIYVSEAYREDLKKALGI
ncbi:MAG: response regulator [Microscillaceae bacterium]|nr:response regulator [Microscillaceae bacterium]